MDVLMLIASLGLWLVPICLLVVYVFNLDIAIVGYFAFVVLGLAIFVKILKTITKK